MTSGAESWALANEMERAYRTWEREILRKTYGPMWDNGYWRIKMNQEIYSINSNQLMHVSVFI